MHYISNDLMAPDVADNLLGKMKAEMLACDSDHRKRAEAVAVYRPQGAAGFEKGRTS